MSLLIGLFKDKGFAHELAWKFLTLKISTQIKVMREKRGWTQSELARKMKTKQSEISLMESGTYGKWTISLLKRFAEVFDVALRVEFQSYLQLARDIQKFDYESCNIPSRIDDLNSPPPAPTKEGRG